MKKIKKLSAGIQKQMDALYDERPNVYKFLVEKGVSSDVAERAQEMIAEHWMDRIHAILKRRDAILDASNEIERRLEKAAGKVADLTHALETAFE